MSRTSPGLLGRSFLRPCQEYSVRRQPAGTARRHRPGAAPVRWSSTRATAGRPSRSPRPATAVTKAASRATSRVVRTSAALVGDGARRNVPVVASIIWHATSYASTRRRPRLPIDSVGSFRDLAITEIQTLSSFRATDSPEHRYPPVTCVRSRPSTWAPRTSWPAPWPASGKSSHVRIPG